MLTLAPSLFALIACTDGGLFGDDTGQTTTDSGTLDTDPHYEEGCILVDGEGGYKFLADALKVAGADGGSITLCEGTLEESVVITSSVTISGPTGVDPANVIWNAPVNEVAAEISGAVGVDLSGFTLSSTRNGLQVDSATSVTISGVTFTDIEGTAITATDAEDLLIEDCEFLSPQLGAVQIDGGTAEITDSLFDYAFGFGVKALGGATVGVTGSTLTGTFYTELSSDGGLDDGWAVWGTQDALIVSTDNVYTDNLAGLFTDEASMDSSGDTVIGGLYGAYCVLGACSVTGGTFTDNLAYGLLLANQGDGVTLTDTVISGDPDLVEDDPDIGLSVGLYVQADGVAEVTDVQIIGHNYIGAIFQPWNGPLEANLTRVDMDNNGRNGLYLSEVDANLEDVNVDNLREVTPGFVTDEYGSSNFVHGWAVSIWGGSNVVWNGGGARDSELINVLNAQSTLYADGIELAGSTYFGVWNYSGDLTINNSTITRAPANGAIYSQNGASLTLDGNLFEDNLETYLSVYDPYGDGSVLYETYYDFYSQDVNSYYDGEVYIRGNTFQRGSRGLQIYGNVGDAEISDNTWTDYNQRAIYLSSQSSSSPVKIDNNTFNNVGGYAIYCSYGAAVFTDLVMDTVPGYISSFDYYENGVFSYSYEATSYGPGIYGYACELEFDTVSVSDAVGHGILLHNSSVSLLDVSVSGGSESGSSSDGSLSVTYDSSNPPDLRASGIHVSGNAVGPGLLVRGYSTHTSGTVELSDVTVTDAAADGIELDTLAGLTAELSDVTVTGSGSAGLLVESTDLLLETASISGNAGVGVSLQGTSGSSANAELVDTSVFDNGGDGVDLDWTLLSLSSTTLTSNAGYGMVCAETTQVFGCDDTDLNSNAEGPHCGCHDSCTELPGPLCPFQPEDGGPDDTGLGDTGDTGAP